MNPDILAWLIKFASRTVILFAVLWMLIKFQKLDQNVKFRFWKLLLVAALTSGLDTIPYSGHYLSVSVLLLGIKIATGSPYADVLFTVGISCALMFMVNLFILASLMGNLQPSNKDAGSVVQWQTAPQEQAVETGPATAAKTNRPVSAAVSNTAPVRVTRYTIKGLSRNGAKSVVTVDTGTKAYTLFLGDTLTMQTAEGTSRVRFESLDADWVTLTVDGKPLKLSAH